MADFDPAAQFAAVVYDDIVKQRAAYSRRAPCGLGGGIE